MAHNYRIMVSIENDLINSVYTLKYTLIILKQKYICLVSFNKIVRKNNLLDGKNVCKSVILIQND